MRWSSSVASRSLAFGAKTWKGHLDPEVPHITEVVNLVLLLIICLCWLLPPTMLCSEVAARLSSHFSALPSYPLSSSRLLGCRSLGGIYPVSLCCLAEAILIYQAVSQALLGTPCHGQGCLSTVVLGISLVSLGPLGMPLD